jgi:hypothetical protein
MSSPGASAPFTRLKPCEVDRSSIIGKKSLRERLDATRGFYNKEAQSLQQRGNVPPSHATPAAAMASTMTPALPPRAIGGARFDDVFCLEREVLGSGRFSEVRRATRRSDGQAVAVKLVERRGGAEGQLSAKCAKCEEEVLWALQRRGAHPHVVRLLRSFDAARKHLVFELLGGGELFTAMLERGALPEAECARCVSELCAALAFVHEEGVMHRDVTRANPMPSRVWIDVAFS